jgi:hypothetical protein
MEPEEVSCVVKVEQDEMADDNEEEMDSKPTFSAVTIPEQYERSQLPDLLRVYYTWLFPYDKYFQWLQYGPGEIHYTCHTLAS